MSDTALSKTWLDTTHMKCLFELFHQEPVVRIAREILGNTLFSAGVTIQKRGSHASVEFENLIRRYWMPFCSSVLDHIYMFGFCPFKKIKVNILKGKKKAKGQNNNGVAEIPFVPPYGTYRVEMRIHEDFTQTYHFYPITRFPNINDKEDPNIKCLVVDKYKPSVDGILRSPMASLLYSFRLSRELYGYAIHAEHLRSHPTLITQSQPNRNKGEANVVEMYEFADGDAYANRAEASYRKNQARTADFHRQQNMASVMNGRGARDANVMIDPLSGNVIRKGEHKQSWEDNVFVLPDGQQLAPSPNPQSRPDLMEMERTRFDIICGVMGVPKTLVLNERGGGLGPSGGANDITYKMFLRTLQGIKNTLVVLLLDVFEEIYNETDCEITFPFIPITAMDDLVALAQQGVISRETLGKHMLTSMGLPESDLDLQPLLIEVEQEKTSATVRPKKRVKA